MAKDKLTNMQEGFCQDIASGKFKYDWQSYENNYSTKNMSKNTIYVETCKLLQNPKISQRISELRQKIIERNEVTIDEVLEQLANWLLFDPLTIVDEDTDCIKRLADMDKKSRMCLGEIKVMEVWDWIPDEDHPKKKKVRIKTGELKTIKFIDKRATAEMFMKKFGQYISEQEELTSGLQAIRDLANEFRSGLNKKQ